jgi:hypothetical protein
MTKTSTKSFWELADDIRSRNQNASFDELREIFCREVEGSEYERSAFAFTSYCAFRDVQVEEVKAATAKRIQGSK